MEGLGWFLTIVVGGLAGWIAERLMQADHSLVTNIVLGIVGAVFLNFVLAQFGVTFAGIFGQLLVAVAGACALIYGYRLFKS